MLFIKPENAGDTTGIIATARGDTIDDLIAPGSIRILWPRQADIWVCFKRFEKRDYKGRALCNPASQTV